MRHKPIRVGKTSSELFGRHYWNLSKAERAVVAGALKDRVLDQADLDRYERGSNEYAFLRRVYFSLRRFSELDAKRNVLSEFEARKFSREFNLEAIAALRDGSFRSMLGEDLACGRDGEGNGDCAAIAIGGATALIVVHPGWDDAPATDREVAEVRSKGIPVVYLEPAHSSIDNFPLAEMVPTHFVNSDIGAHPLDFEGDRLIMTGGFMQNCFRTALRMVLARRKTDGPLTIVLPAEAIYVHKHRSELLSDVLEKQRDPLAYLSDEVKWIMAGHMEDFDRRADRGDLTSPQFKYDAEVCFRGACRMLAPTTVERCVEVYNGASYYGRQCGIFHTVTRGGPKVRFIFTMEDRGREGDD